MICGPISPPRWSPHKAEQVSQQKEKAAPRGGLHLLMSGPDYMPAAVMLTTKSPQLAL